MKHHIIGTAGHVDHGKTALVKLLTNIDCDTHKEEKRRGITINLGFSHLQLAHGESVGIIDVPGHKDFINTMVGGACGIDMVLLVIAADSGIMPQTIEHINIISALGIKKGVVALTKVDLVDADLLEMALFEISGYLEKTALANAPIIGVSAVSGEGKEALVDAISQTLADIEEEEKSSLFRMYIDRIFTVKGFGNVVTGSVLGGQIETGKEVFLLPGESQKLRIRSIERHGKPVEKAEAGDRAAINLIGLKNEDFERGMLISDKPLKATRMMDAHITLFNSSITAGLWTNVIFLSGTFECQARMHLLDKEKAHPGESAIVQIHLGKAGVLVNKDRFILRNSSGDITLGGGYVIDAAPLHHRRRTLPLTEALTRLSTSVLEENSSRDSIVAELKKEFRPFSLIEISEKLSINVEELRKELDSEHASYLAYAPGGNDILILTSYDQAFREKITLALSEYHSKFPIFPDGMEANEIIGKLGLQKLKIGKQYLDLLLENMKATGILDLYKNTWILHGHKPRISPQDAEEIQWLENEILAYGDSKPVLLEIEEKGVGKNITKARIKLFLSYLTREGRIHFLQGDFIHSSILNKYRISLLKELSTKNDGMEIQEFKDSIGGTKKMRALLADMYEAEKIIRFQKGASVETRLFITEYGKKILHESLS
ncbi:MAG: selenocysteine-specific translation elongation factor [Bacteroidetes bacterium HGW-Bacteroidetes-21]|jgi:selenocysteine-specific elongation factor|nr:MAG: selenocysteine-specific translation elongation factor [Bacteroidetes bacterium HGW-Bacteroidetes-21]